ncbi:MAG: sulfotransferase family protein [Acidimicrobiia bacterium]
MTNQKVFGIGFHKTGTTSLARALRVLGYRVAGPFGVHDADISATVVARAIETAGEWDAAQDNPWPIVFRDLDRAFPDSKFILTTRVTDDWLRSVVRHFGGTTTPMREWVYGVGDPAGNESVYRERYERHNREVVEYFAERPQDLLVFRLADGDGWEELCGFLGVAVPEQPFPHANARGERSTMRVLTRRARRILGLGPRRP